MPLSKASDSPEEVSLESEMAETSKAENDRSIHLTIMTRSMAIGYRNHGPTTAGWSDEFSERQIADTSTPPCVSICWLKFELAHFSELDAAIATAIVYALDDDGFLIDDIPEIRESLLPEIQVEDDEIIAVLHRVQRLEPVGVASRDTGECIRVQLQGPASRNSGVDLALRLARDFLKLVADNAYEDMRRETGATSENLKQALELIRGWNHVPGHVSTTAVMNTWYPMSTFVGWRRMGHHAEPGKQPQSASEQVLHQPVAKIRW